MSSTQSGSNASTLAAALLVAPRGRLGRVSGVGAMGSYGVAASAAVSAMVARTACLPFVLAEHRRRLLHSRTQFRTRRWEFARNRHNARTG